MSILSTLSRIAHEYHDARVRYLTEREVSALPPEIRKDIGWPTAEGDRRTQVFRIGQWAGGR